MICLSGTLLYVYFVVFPFLTCFFCCVSSVCVCVYINRTLIHVFLLDFFLFLRDLHSLYIFIILIRSFQSVAIVVMIEWMCVYIMHVIDVARHCHALPWTCMFIMWKYCLKTLNKYTYGNLCTGHSEMFLFRFLTL